MYPRCLPPAGRCRSGVEHMSHWHNQVRDYTSGCICMYQIPRDGLTSEIYFFKSLWAFDLLFHVSSKVIYAEL